MIFSFEESYREPIERSFGSIVECKRFLKNLRTAEPLYQTIDYRALTMMICNTKLSISLLSDAISSIKEAFDKIATALSPCIKNLTETFEDLAETIKKLYPMRDVVSDKEIDIRINHFTKETRIRIKVNTSPLGNQKTVFHRARDKC